MRKVHDLIEDIRRAGRGERVPAGPETEDRPAPPDPRDPVRPEDFDLAMDVDLEDDPGPSESPRFSEPAPGPESDLWFDLESVSPGAEDPEPAPAPARPKKTRRRIRLRRPRPLPVLVGVLVVALVAGGWFAYDRLFRDDALPGDEIVGPGAVGEQAVATWSVADPSDPDAAFLAVVAAGPSKTPIVLGIPAYAVTYTPGYGDGAIADVLASGDAALAAGAVENVLGVRVDASTHTDLGGLAAAVDGVGGIRLDGRVRSGDQAVDYLLKGGSGAVSAEFRFLRWLEVATGILAAADGRVDALAPLDEPVARVVAAAGSGGAETLELPVVDIGSGLARPDVEATKELVGKWFVPTALTTREVRLAVMNGVGTPGIAPRVSRILIPSGFKLVSSVNAPTFDWEETQIVATSKEFLPEAELAHELLGTGKVYVDRHPSNLVDVTVIVGSDFGGS